MEMVQRPKVLFIGNGVYYNKNFDWSEVIEKYVGNSSFSGLSDKVPNTISNNDYTFLIIVLSIYAIKNYFKNKVII